MEKQKLLITHAGGCIGHESKTEREASDEMLYPVGVNEEKLMTNEELKTLQDWADEKEVLLPTEFNRSLDSKSEDQDDEILMPIITK